jgi:hypothetical protein
MLRRCELGDHSQGLEKAELTPEQASGESLGMHAFKPELLALVVTDVNVFRHDSAEIMIHGDTSVYHRSGHMDRADILIHFLCQEKCSPGYLRSCRYTST